MPDGLKMALQTSEYIFVIILDVWLFNIICVINLYDIPALIWLILTLFLWK